MLSNALISQVKALQPAERIEFIEMAWESLSGEEIPLSEYERGLLDERLAHMEQNPEAQSPWDEVQARLNVRRCD